MRRILAGGLVAWAVLAGAPPRSVDAAFPGPNGHIAYVARNASGFESVWVIDPTGQNAREFVRHTAGPDIVFVGPRWSPDGRRLAYRYKYTNIPGSSWGLGIADCEGTSLSLVTVVGGAQGRPTWSPDGTKLAYTETDGIRVVDVNTKAITLLVANNGIISNAGVDLVQFTYDEPVWSPDGSKIAVRMRERGFGAYALQSDIVMVPAAGGAVANLTRPVGVPGYTAGLDGSPDWAPDGKRILFSAGNQRPGVVGTLHTVDPATRVVSGTATSGGFINAVYSPDGTQILAEYLGIGWIMNADGTGLHQHIPGQVIGSSAGGPLDWRPFPLDGSDPLGDVDLTMRSETAAPGRVLPGETIRYSIEFTVITTEPDATIVVKTDAPPGTTLVAGSASAGAVVTGNHVEWTIGDRCHDFLTFRATVAARDKLPTDLTQIAGRATASVLFDTGLKNASDDEVLDIGAAVLTFGDASAGHLGGLFLPDAKNAKDLPAAFDWSTRRQIEGIAADGVALLVVRASTYVKKHGKFRFSVAADPETGGETGSFWDLDDRSIVDESENGGARDDMPAGPAELDVSGVPNPRDKKEKIAFALYRAPRNFDAPPRTGFIQSRAVKLKVEIFDADDAQVVATDEAELRVVRPLVFLQHGTFDSPDGWNQSQLHYNSGHELRQYEVFNPLVPFQTHRGNFNTYQGAAGHLGPSALVAWRVLREAMENWRTETGYAGAQADVVCHSYGGVNMRWIAQSQGSSDPVSNFTLNNFRNALNWGHGEFHKLITIATTHRGSAVSNQLAVLNANGAEAGVIAAIAGVQQSWISRGAVEDQMVVSPILRRLKRTRAPCHAIAGSGLCEFNKNYELRLFSLWAGDTATGPFKSLGTPYDDVVSQIGPHYDVFRKMSNYGFNLSQTLQDDTAAVQDPNYDLTVSSWSSKGGIALSAQSTYQHLLGGSALVGRLTHGDEIAAGANDPARPDAVAFRVGQLLREPTNSSLFDDFPGFDEVPLTPTEQEFSNQERFDPAWLYVHHAAVPGADGPTMTVDPPGPAVAPSQSLLVSLESPKAGIAGGVMGWESAQPGAPRFLVLGAGATTRTIIVPNRRPGPFSIGAFVTSPAGDSQYVAANLEIVDPTPYVELRASPGQVSLRGAEPSSVTVRGKLATGLWRYLNESSLLVLTSSDPAVVSITADRTLQPGSFGTATVTATYDGGIATTVEVTVTGETVPVAAAPAKRGLIKARARKAVEFVFLSGQDFDPASIDPASVRVGGLAPAKFKRKKDYNKDGVRDLAAFVGPRDLALAAGAASIPMAAVQADGLRVAGYAAVTVK